MGGCPEVTDEEVRLTSKGRATRDRIVDAAAVLIFAHGVTGTSLDEVCSAAAVGKSQLYHYFDDKASLVLAVVATQTERVLTVQRGLDTWTAWSAWRDLVVDVQRRTDFVGGCPIGSLASELADTDEPARGALATSFARWEDAFRTGLATMRQRGVLRLDADPDRLALATLATLQGGLLLSQTCRDAGPLEVALDAAIAYLRHYAS